MPLTRPVASIACFAAAALLIGSGAARAQSIDYGALESLFGEPVTTSVTGSPQRASDVPASMTIVTADDIRRSGARDLPGILRHVAGVDVLQWTNDQADIAVRGYNQPSSPRLLVLIDGRQVYTDYYGYTPWSTLPVVLADIRQIEIVRGPNSALFGFNAVGGVINIITYNPLFDDANTMSMSAGTQGLAEGSAVLTHKFGSNAGVRLSASGQRNDDFTTPQAASDVGTRLGTKRFSADLDGRFRLGANLYAGFDVSHTEVRLPEVSPLYFMFFVRYRTSSVKASLSADTDWGLLRATTYANWFKVNAETPILPGFYFPYETVAYVTQLEDIFKAGSAHTFRISAEYRHDAVPTGPVTGGNVSYDLVSGGAMWRWAVTPALSVTNAIRVDHLVLDRTGLVPPGYGLTNSDWNGRTLTEASFNSGIVWQIDDEDTLRLTAARGVQLPNLLNLGGLVQYAPTGYSAGVPFLKPEIVMNYEIGLTRIIPSLDGQFIVRAFRQSNRDIISNFGGTLLSQGLVSTPVNIGSSDATGLELSIQGEIAEDWRWGLSYTPEVIEDHFSPAYPLALTIVDYQHTNPVHVVNANLGWSQGPWEVDGYLRYKSRFFGIQGGNLFDPVGSLVRIPDYVSVDARIAYRVTDNLTLAFSGQNLLQSPQKQTSAPEVERRVYVTASVGF